MGRIFYRQYPRAFWEPYEWEGPLKDISLREWEIAVILASQHQEIDRALRRWLETPTDHQRWPWSNKVPHLRALYAVGELSKPVDTLLDLFHDEIKTIRETLDFPIEVFSGPNRNALLAAHGQRLRWLVRRLGLKRALEEIAQLTAPAPQVGKERSSPPTPSEAAPKSAVSGEAAPKDAPRGSPSRKARLRGLGRTLPLLGVGGACVGRLGGGFAALRCVLGRGLPSPLGAAFILFWQKKTS